MIKAKINKEKFKEYFDEDTFECVEFECGFDEDEIKEMVENSELTEEQMVEIADTLVWNLEIDFDEFNGKLVYIDEDNFNDSFEDVIDNLVAEYEVK